MAQHSHDFIETYQGLVGFGLDRTTDENTLIWYLQKFSADELMAVLRHRLSDAELGKLFDMLSQLMHKHLSEQEYHALFLKDHAP